MLAFLVFNEFYNTVSIEYIEICSLPNNIMALYKIQ